MRTTISSDDPLLVPMEVINLTDDVVTVLVEGDIDMDEAGELRAVLGDASSGSHRTVIVDLSGVHFLGSSGMGVLAGLSGRLADQDRTLLIRGCRPPIRRAFEVTSLDQVLNLE